MRIRENSKCSPLALAPTPVIFCPSPIFGTSIKSSPLRAICSAATRSANSVVGLVCADAVLGLLCSGVFLDSAFSRKSHTRNRPTPAPTWEATKSATKMPIQMPTKTTTSALLASDIGDSISRIAISKSTIMVSATAAVPRYLIFLSFVARTCPVPQWRSFRLARPLHNPKIHPNSIRSPECPAPFNTDHKENLQLLCGGCNRVKGDRGMEYLLSSRKMDGIHRMAAPS